MTNARHVWIVTQWEFRRFFRWKDQLFSLAIFLLVSIVWTGSAFVAGLPGSTVTIALDGIDIPTKTHGRFTFVPAPAAPAARARALQDGTVQGVLSRRSDGGFGLLVAKDPTYRAELTGVLDGIVRRERLEVAGVTAAALQHILEPAVLDVRFANPERARVGRAEKIAALCCVGIMLIAIFTSLSYLLVGITGEKQLRVTESVISAISPQAWIDGKVIGISAYAIVSVANVSVGLGLIGLAAQFASGFVWPSAALRPAVVAVLLLYTVLGLLLWNAFFAAVAATVNDMYTSSRSSLMFLPVLPVALSAAVIKDPDGVVARFLALLPFTSAPALPMRLVLSDPGIVEVGVSLALLAGAVWAMRTAAGRIFQLGILLYGKEPSLDEIARWATARMRDVRAPDQA